MRIHYHTSHPQTVVHNGKRLYLRQPTRHEIEMLPKLRDDFYARMTAKAERLANAVAAPAEAT